MQKFLKVTNAATTGQLIAVEGIKAISTASPAALTVVISYFDGTATTVTLTVAQVGSDVYEKIVDSIELALQTSWVKPYYEVSLPKAVTSIVNA
jgi:hypothetical protein